MTTLVKQSPLTELESVERRFRRMFENWGFGPTMMPAIMPAADVYEAAGEYVVELEVPGFEEKELGVQVSNHMLTVKGTRTETKEEKEKAFLLHERLEREFERTFTLPSEVDTGHITATFEKGVLKVHAPIPTHAEPRKVEISKT
jgi:HSP20 family protein